MKFSLSVANNGGRLGVLSEFGRFGSKISTPTCMVYTRGGIVPHLTPDISQNLYNIPHITEMPLPLLVEHTDVVESYGQGLAQFTSTQGGVLICTVQDSACKVPSGHNSVKGVSLWGRCGKLKVDVPEFMRVQEVLRPDCYQSLSDADTDEGSGKQRVRKSVDRTLEYLDDILELHAKSEVLDLTSVFGSIEGGYVEAERSRSAKETASRNVDGFVIEGFHSHGPDSEHRVFSDVQHLVSAALNELPLDKPRLMQSVWPPHSILHAVRVGIDIFDGSHPYVVTERGAALTFRYKTPSDENPDEHGQTPSRGYEICLHDKKNFDDLSPIVSGCQCYTCTSFSRAYVHHLLNTSELLAPVLLMIHNLHHYYAFFSEIRETLRLGHFELLERLIDQQTPDTHRPSDVSRSVNTP